MYRVLTAATAERHVAHGGTWAGGGRDSNCAEILAALVDHLNSRSSGHVPVGPVNPEPYRLRCGEMMALEWGNVDFDNSPSRGPRGWDTPRDRSADAIALCP